MPDPFAGSRTQNNEISIEFDPTESTKASNCEQIVMVQFVRMFADGKVIQPGDYEAALAYRDAYTTDEGWYVDALKDENTPDYQQGGKYGTVGAVNGTTITATIGDAPWTGGGDKGFKSSTNPSGWNEVCFEFQTFCWCMKGSQCNVWYEGMSWKYEKTAANASGLGRSTIVSSPLADFPQDLRAAFDKFNEVKNFKPCT